MELKQKVFDFYIAFNKAATTPISQFFDNSDPSSYKLSIRNYNLDDNTAKSIACIIPFLVDLDEVELRNNQITDNVAGVIAMACFANPRIKRLTFSYNYLRNAFARTFRKL